MIGENTTIQKSISWVIKLTITLISVVLLARFLEIEPHFAQYSLIISIGIVASLIQLFQHIFPSSMPRKGEKIDSGLPSEVGLVNVPPLPNDFIPRPRYIEKAKKALLSPNDKSMAITGTFRKVGLEGMGGIGKTVLASALARDDQIRKAFPDGIIWIGLGQQPDLNVRQLQLARSLNESNVIITDIQDGLRCLSQLLKEKSCLIILDDVWKIEHLQAFNVLGSNCKMLITTRDNSIVRSFGAIECQIDVLSDEESLELLAQMSGQRKETLPSEAKAVAKECDNLPLALAMVGIMAKGMPNRWSSILYRLQSADLEKIKSQFPEYPYPNLLLAIEVSVAALEASEQRCYLDLAVFAKGVDIPVKALQVLWDMDEYDMLDLVGILADRSLARLEGGLLSLHDLQHDFIVKRLENLKKLHNRFLDAYRKKCSNGWPSGPNDGYFFQNLAYHLSESGKYEELAGLLLDFYWIRAKFQATDAFSLMSDYDYLKVLEDVQLVKGAIRLSVNSISHDPSQLNSQLLGRLMWHGSPKIQALVKQIHQDSLKVHLSPLTSSLIAPGGPLIRILLGHTGSINTIALTVNGRTAVSGSDDFTLRVWDLETGKEIKTLKGHTGSVTSVAATPDGKTAVSGSDDDTLRVWNLETGMEIRVLKGHTGWINAVAVTTDCKKAISGSWDDLIRIWDLEIGKKVGTLEGHARSVYTVDMTPDGQMAISGSDDTTLKVWDLERKKEIWTLRGHTGSVYAVAMTPDGRMAISGSYDNTLKVWDLETGKEIWTLRGHTGSVYAVAMTPDGRMAISGSYDGTIKIWDLDAGDEVRTLRAHNDSINAVAITATGRIAISGSDDDTIKMWDMEIRKELRTPEGHTSFVSSAAMTLDGRRVVSGSWDNTLKLWDMETGKEIRTLKGHLGPVYAVAVTPDGRMAISGSDDDTLKVWNLETGGEIRTLKGHFGWIYAVAITPDGRRVVSGSWDNTLKLWDMETGKEIRTLKGHLGPVYAVAVTPDGRMAISGSDDDTLKVWNLETGGEIRTLRGHTGSINAIDIAENGRIAISGSEDHTLKVWDLETGNDIITLKGHNDSVNTVGIILADRMAVSGSNDGTLRVWDVKNGKQIAIFCGDGPISAIATAPNADRIVAGESSGSIHFLRLKNGDREYGEAK
jgi:WD40 repeat protein